MKSLFLTSTGQIDGHVFCVPSTIYDNYLILGITSIISIVLLSVRIHSVLDSEQDQERRRISRDLNLMYKLIPSVRGNKIFICDTFDTTALNLSTLVAGRFYESYSYAGHQGFLIGHGRRTIHEWPYGSRDACLKVLTTYVNLITSRGSRILSRVAQIHMQDSFDSAGMCKSLLVKEI